MLWLSINSWGTCILSFNSRLEVSMYPGGPPSDRSSHFPAYMQMFWCFPSSYYVCFMQHSKFKSFVKTLNNTTAWNQCTKPLTWHVPPIVSFSLYIRVYIYYIYLFMRAIWEVTSDYFRQQMQEQGRAHACEVVPHDSVLCKPSYSWSLSVCSY
jgi:hypothetical protein